MGLLGRWDSSLTAFNGYFMNERATVLQEDFVRPSSWCISSGKNEIFNDAITSPTDAVEGPAGNEKEGQPEKSNIDEGDIDDGESDDEIQSFSGSEGGDAGENEGGDGESDDDEDDDINASGGGEEEGEEEEDGDTTDEEDDEISEDETLEDEEPQPSDARFRTSTRCQKQEDAAPEINVNREESISLATSTEGGKGTKKKLVKSDVAGEEDSSDVGPSKAKKPKSDP